MSIPRKRGKVKKKTRADKVKGRKKKSSVNTRGTRQPPRKARPKPKPVKRKKKESVKRQFEKSAERKKAFAAFVKRAKKKRAKKKRSAEKKRETPKQKQARLTRERLEFEVLFLRSPGVSAQIQDRMIEKGLMSLMALTDGMVRTTESYMLLQLIGAEQFGDFDKRALELSAEFNWPIQDVYELWHSPETGLS